MIILSVFIFFSLFSLGMVYGAQFGPSSLRLIKVKPNFKAKLKLKFTTTKMATSNLLATKMWTSPFQSRYFFINNFIFYQRILKFYFLIRTKNNWLKASSRLLRKRRTTIKLPFPRITKTCRTLPSKPFDEHCLSLDLK